MDQTQTTPPRPAPVTTAVVPAPATGADAVQRALGLSVRTPSLPWGNRDRPPARA